MVFKPNNLTSVQIEFGGNQRYPSQPIEFTPSTSSPTYYQDLYQRFRKVLGIDSELAAMNAYDYQRYWQNCFVTAIDTSIYGTDPNAISPIDENQTVLFLIQKIYNKY